MLINEKIELTRRFVVLQCDDVSRSLFQSFKEVNDQIPDILSVGALECEFFASYSRQGEGLSENLVCP